MRSGRFARLRRDCCVLSSRVSIAPPDRDHIGPTLAALEHECSVLPEKPLAMSSSEVAVIAAAASAPAALASRPHPSVFGSLRCVASASTRWRGGGSARNFARSDRSRDDEPQYPDMHPAMLTMIHDIDTVLWVSGSQALRVSVRTRCWIGGRLAQVEAADGSI